MPFSYLKNYKLGAIFATFTMVLLGLLILYYALMKSDLQEVREKKFYLTLNGLIDTQNFSNNISLDKITLDKSSDIYDTELLYQGISYISIYPGFINKKGIKTLDTIIVESATNQGYSGNIDFVMALKKDLLKQEIILVGARIVASTETPGFGDKINQDKTDWLNQLSNKSFSLQNFDEQIKQFSVLKQDGGDIDGFTGATVTPRAFLAAIKELMIYLNKNWDEILKRVQ